MLKRIALLVILLLAAGAAAQEGPALSGVEGIRNFLRVNEKICTGGQPTLEQLAELKAGGIRAVLNLRRPTEKQTMRPGGEPVPYDAAAEAAEAERLGLRHLHIPRAPVAPPPPLHPLRLGQSRRGLLDDPPGAGGRVVARRSRSRGQAHRPLQRENSRLRPRLPRPA